MAPVSNANVVQAPDNVVPLRPALPEPAVLRERACGFPFGFRPPRDARLYQILFLASLLTFGVLVRDFTLHPVQMLLAFAAGLATQAAWIGACNLANKGYLSALITCFGLSILLRADSAWVHPLAACLAISAKFVVRWRGKHLYNPANLGVVLATTLLPGAWISPGQWGNALAVAVWFVALGGLVTERARRGDIAWAFLAAWLGAVALRVAWLGQSWSVWWHQLGSGGLLLFAFFMISDPMTIPNDRRARVLYALLVVAIAYAWQYVLFRPNALVWALFLATPAVPLLDRLLPAPVFAWRGTRTA
jgi:Na+-transporting NADH:ubiquinone oxidoreductase subunit NqrB